MQVNRNTYTVQTQMIKRAPAPTTTTPQTSGAVSLSKAPSAEVTKYIQQRGSDAGPKIKGADLIKAKIEKAQELGGFQIDQNASGVKAWLKSSSLYKFFAGDSSKATDTKGMEVAEAVNDSIGHTADLAIKGHEDVLKVGSKQGDLQKTTDALHGRGEVPTGEDAQVQTPDEISSTVGIGTAGLAFVKGLSDGYHAIQDLSEASGMIKESGELKEQAYQAMGLHAQIGDLLGGRGLAALQKPGPGNTKVADASKIDGLVTQISAFSPGADTSKLKDAFKSMANGQALSPDQRAMLGGLSTDLHRTSLERVNQAKVLNTQGKVARREAALELGKASGGVIEKATAISSKIIEVADKTAVTHLAQAASVTGIAATVGATVEMGVNIHAAVKASGVKNAMKALRYPSKESFLEAAGSLEKKSNDLKTKAAKTTDPGKKAGLLERAKELDQTAGELRAASNDPNKIEAAKMQSLDMNAAAKQVQKRQGLGAKILSVCIASLKVAAGIAATVAVFAGAAALAATPVGWALAGAALVGGIALGCYKMKKSYDRFEQNTQLQQAHLAVKAKLTSSLPDQGGAPSSSRITELKAVRTDLSNSLDDVNRQLVLSSPTDPDFADLTTKKGKLTQAVSDMDTQISKMEAIVTLESGMPALQQKLDTCTQKVEALKTKDRELTSQINDLNSQLLALDAGPQSGGILNAPTLTGSSVSGGKSKTQLETEIRQLRIESTSTVRELMSARQEESSAKTALDTATSNLATQKNDFKQAYPSKQELMTLDKDLTVLRCRKDPDFAAKRILKNLGSTDPNKKMEAQSIVQSLGLNLDDLTKKAVGTDDEKGQAVETLLKSLNPS
ncbi:hypothetical protein COW20_19045 [bacterium (Candidatus Blackallbacteria) CG13_big_fil_rev_8_21_14_2_50_49_14]|nr:MAG: hypothetical protein COW20_19045 [bacterium (Candidatus Blackallbacteria) CG13_big_fil_rev_8_21_14_2_50_49_14]